MKEIDIVLIKTNEKLYISKIDKRYNSEVSYSGMQNYIIDGNTPKKTLNENYNCIEKTPISIKEKKKKTDTVYYKLKDSFPITKDTPKKIYNYDDYLLVQNIYERVIIEGEKYFEEVLFNVIDIIETDKIKEVPNKMEFRREPETSWGGNHSKIITQKDICYSLVTKLITPEILLPTKDCFLNSSDTYAIVRAYIKDNINPKYAEITSDFDFCFTVKKKIPFSIPEKYTVDVNNSLFQKRKRVKKLETRYRKHNLITICEMAPKEYQSYSVIRGFVAKNQDELKEKIDEYLNNLINFINEPLVECKHCSGKGVIIDKLYKDIEVIS